MSAKNAMDVAFFVKLRTLHWSLRMRMIILTNQMRKEVTWCCWRGGHMAKEVDEQLLGGRLRRD